MASRQASAKVAVIGAGSVGATIAYACLLRLPLIEERDFVGLGLADHVQQKIYANLIFRGHLQ